MQSRPADWYLRCRPDRLALILLLATSSFACANGYTLPSPGQVSRFEYRDVFDLKWAEDVQISPDGRSIAYTRVEADIRADEHQRSIWLIDVPSHRERMLAANAGGARWSPTGTHVAFVSHNALGKAELVIASQSGSRMEEVQTLPTDPSTLVWAPDGQHIAFTRSVPNPPTVYTPPVRKPRGANWVAVPRVVNGFAYQEDGERFGTDNHSCVFVLDLHGKSLRQITGREFNPFGSPVWSADGEEIFVIGSLGEKAGRTYFTNQVFRVLSRGGPAVAISPPGMSALGMAVAPSGKWLSFVAAAPNDRDYRPSSMYLMTLKGGELRELTLGLDRDIVESHFAIDGGSIFISYGDRGHVVLARLPVEGKQENLVPDIGDDGKFSVAANGTVTFTTASTTRPADVAIRSANENPSRLTELNEALLSRKSLAELRPLAFRSQLDNAEVHGSLILLPGNVAGQRRPMILSIHGGPHGFDEPNWNTQDQLFAAAGYAVLRVDYRGSTSYGYAFADRIARDFPGPAYEDIMSGVDAALATGLVDSNRLFVTGGSAGGELTAWIVGLTPRFKAAAAVKPVINITSLGLTTYQYGYIRLAYGTYPWEDPKGYWKRSPLSRVDHVSTPVLLMVGEDDHNTPVCEAEQFYDALRLLDKPAELVVLPDAGHDSIAKPPSRQIASIALTLDWFAHYGGPSQRDDEEASGLVQEDRPFPN